MGPRILWPGALALVGVLLITACTGPQGPGRSPADGPAGARSSGAAPAPKRITAAILGDPYTLSARLNTSGPGSNVPGTDALEDLVSAGLANADSRRELRPQLAEAVPTIENGLWKVFPDGRMETTWTIKRNAAWHDGVPFTAEDILFTARIGGDRELGWEFDVAYDWVDGIQAPSPYTVTVAWSRPYIEANTMFSRASGRSVPLPRHVLEPTYTENKAGFFQHPYWGQEFLGTGPFRVRDWVPGSRLVLEANEGYVLGRPHLDQIEVRFIVDPRTLAANILGGAVELTMGRGISLEQALQIRDQWANGKMDFRLSNWIVVYPQLIDANPPVVANVQFRRALLHAINRQEMVDSLMAGLVPVGHGYLSPDDPDFADTQSSVVRYEYDTRRASQLIEGLGYTRGGDGVLRDASGQRLGVEIRAGGGGEDIPEKATLSVAHYWQQSGVAAEPVIVPPQRIRDRAFSATFSGFYLRQNPNDAARLNRFHSSRTPLPENRFVGDNNPRYMNPEFDALIERYLITIARRERLQVLGELVHHVSDRLIMMGLFFNIEPTMIANRLTNVAARGPGSTQAWNAEQWDVTH